MIILKTVSANTLKRLVFVFWSNSRNNTYIWKKQAVNMPCKIYCHTTEHRNLLNRDEEVWGEETRGNVINPNKKRKFKPKRAWELFSYNVLSNQRSEESDD